MLRSVSVRRIAVFDPSGRLQAEAARVAEKGRMEVVALISPTDPMINQAHAVLVAAPVAGELPPPGVIAPPRWVVGDQANATRLAGAAVAAAAAGVLLSPLGPESLFTVLEGDKINLDSDLARARALIATPLMDISDLGAEALRALASSFNAHDCIVWWRDGETMTPMMARAEPYEGYRSGVAAAARIAAAAGGTTVIGAGGGAGGNGERKSEAAARAHDTAKQVPPPEAPPAAPAPASAGADLAIGLGPAGLATQPPPNEATEPVVPAALAAGAGPPRISPSAVMAEALRASPNEVSGLLAIVSDRARRFSSAERADLRAIAGRVTRELALRATHKRLVAEGERLSASSMHDPLTGAQMRGAFEQAITHEVAAATRRREVVTLVLVDVLGLRRINLEHGHKAGDELLAQLATRIRACVRSTDPIGRLGGDELAVLLVSATDVQGTAVARKIISRVHKDPIVVDDVRLDVRIRVVLSEVARGERSGEAAFARCYSALRTSTPGDPTVVPPDDRHGEADTQIESPGLAVGTVVGGTYRVLHELSRGAMGVVYRGEDLGLGRAVAIKVLRSDLASDRELVVRFRAEAGILASLHHDNLVAVYSLGEHAGDVYFVMELVEGQPLSDVLRRTLDRDEWFPVAAVIQITSEIADALDAMHARGLIHRDVKPANILLDRERDRAVLVDVGVAAKTGAAREAAGTPGFAAPESFYEGGDSPPTDVYGLAATVYCVLTGRAPFGSGQPLHVVQRQLHDPLPAASSLRPSLPPAVDAVLAKALDPAPRKRWASASTFAIALARALQPMKTDEAPTPRAVTADPERKTDGVMGPTAALSAEEMSRMPTQSSSPAPSQRVIAGQLRAFHVRVLSKALAHHLGEAALLRITEERPHLLPLIGQHHGQRLAPLAWVELSAFCELLDHAVEILPTHDISRRVGRSTIAATFTQLFGADPASLPIALVLSAAPTFWPRYHDWGPITIAAGEAHADLTITGYPGSRNVCEMVAGQLGRIVELAGGGDVTVDSVTCAMDGAPSCRYSLTWIPRSDRPTRR
jgi:diguanylate cyclase (GGDEF)-like protein